MSSAPAAEAPADEGEAKPKKKKPILLILVIVLSLIILIGGSVFGTLFVSGYFEHKSEAAAHDKIDELEKAAEDARSASPDTPTKVKKESTETSRFENTYLQIDKEFMTNITGSKKVMVVQLAIMTHYDSRVFDNVKKHEFAVRSAVLDVMRQSTEADIAKPEFRTELAAKIKEVMNAMLMMYEDFGGVEDVFFTSFVMQ
jgi:flagellar FliL protein